MLMEDDLRLAGYGYPTSQTKITTATATSITFWADVTGATAVLSATANAGATILTVNTTAGLKVGDTIYLINGNQWESQTISALGGGGTTVTISMATTTSYTQGTVVGRAQTDHLFVGQRHPDQRRGRWHGCANHRDWHSILPIQLRRH